MREGLEGKLYVNRELSWLEFNRRVLFEAKYKEVPLMERLKFIAIYFSNLDEFFMVRVGSLTDLKELQPDKIDDKTGWTPAQQLDSIYKRVRELEKEAEKVYSNIVAELKANNIDILNVDKLNKVEELLAEKHFKEAIYPLLSPQIIDKSHPFPFLKNKESYVVVVLDNKKSEFRIGIVPILNLEKFIVFNVDNRQKVVFVADLVKHFAYKLFGKEEIEEVSIVRVTRNADISVDEAILESDTDVDFRGIMQGLLKKRRKLAPVRIQFSKKVSDRLMEHLCEKISLTKNEVFISQIPLDFSFGFKVGKFLKANEDMFFKEHKPIKSLNIKKGNLIPYILQKDILLSFPFESISPFVELLYEAADNPNVVSIKISLYRLANHSKIVAALAYAAERGKEVLCVLELRARFDEQSNIDYASVLEDAGCTVIYGLGDYKIHAKLCVIMLKHYNSISYISQIGTGNYNESTSEQYTDLSFITSDYKIGEDGSNMFRQLCLGEVVTDTKELWIAPNCYKTNLMEMIDSEIERNEKYGDGYIGIKVNSMNDIDVMNKLIEASQAGVKIELIIRGICCLRPKVEKYTENITIKSIVGKYLEHSRIFVFGKQDRARVYIGSGDLLNRNTRRRIEVFAPIKSAEAKKEVLRIFELCNLDNKKAWIMQKNGEYIKAKNDGVKPLGAQEFFEDYYSKVEVKGYSEKNIFKVFLDWLTKDILKKP